MLRIQTLIAVLSTLLANQFHIYTNFINYICRWPSGHRCNAMSKAIHTILLLLILLQLLSILPAEPLYVHGSQFVLRSYSYKSSAGYTKVYPGSRNVHLAVEVLYTGSSKIAGITGCLVNLPPGFSPSRGHTACSAPYTPNGSTYDIVSPGDIVVFEYYIDIARDVVPNTYSFDINITYRNISTGQILYDLISNIVIKVSNYPPLNLTVLRVYWDPDAYPGSADVTLNIVLRNDGESTVVSGDAVLTFSDNVFYPIKSVLNMPSMNIGETATMAITGIDVLVNASPDRVYLAELKINVTARTRDGVDYRAYTKIPIYVRISEAPTPYLTVLDYGVTAPRITNNTVETSIYLTFRNLDNTLSVNSVTALFKIKNGANFTNSSATCVRVSQGPYNYGDTFTITSCPLIVNSSSRAIEVELTLTVFGSRNGAEFWSTRVMSFEIPIRKSLFRLYIASTWWRQQIAYPGSENVDLVIALENHDTATLNGIIAKLTLPECFYPRSITTTLNGISQGQRGTLVFSGISIDPNCKAGTYIANLSINGVAQYRDGSYHNVSLSYEIAIEVSSKESKVLELIDTGWRSGKAYMTSIGAVPYISLRVAKPLNVENMVIEIKLPPQFMFEDGRSCRNITVQQTLRYGQSLDVALGSIIVTTTKPGIYPVALRILAIVSYNGVEQIYTQNTTILLKVLEPHLNVTLIDVGLLAGATERTYGATAYTVLQIKQLDTVRILIVKLRLGEGARYADGRNIALWTYVSTLRYGDVVTARFQNIEIITSKKSVDAEICVHAVLEMNSGARYTASKCFNTTLKLIGNSTYILLSRVENVYDGRPSPLLPTSRGIAIRVYLTNLGADTITAINPRIVLPSGFELRGYRGTCQNGVASGASCYIDVIVDVGNVKPGDYIATLLVNYSIRRGGSVEWFEQSIAVPITVDKLQKYIPSVVPVTWFWGTTAPITVYEHSRYVPLTILLMNRGRYAVMGVEIKVKPLNSSANMISGSAVCSPSLGAGASCRATVYLDLANVGPGTLLLNLSVRYLFSQFGTHIEIDKSFPLRLMVARYAGGRGLEVVDTYWANHWPVYPDTENATLSIVLANRWPYRVRGVDVWLYLPPGFTCNGKRVAHAYVAGPIDSLGTATLSFRITVGEDIVPGTYNATLVMNYVVESGDGGLNITETRVVQLRVHGLEEAVELLTPQWLYGSPEPGTYGAQLAIYVRNNLVPIMRGPILEVQLPKGVTCSLNNGSRALIQPVVAPYTMVPQQASASSSIQSIIATLIRRAQSGATQMAQFSYGDIVSFIVPLNIGRNTSSFVIKATLSFIDQWSNVRRIRLDIPVKVFGSTKLIEVHAQPSIKIVNGRARFTIFVVNRGSAPIYDVYLVLVPRTPLLIPLQGVEYIDRIDPGEAENVTFILVYNPSSIISGGGAVPIQIQSTSFVATLGVLFRDVTGFQRHFNASLAAVIEPFIQLGLGSDTRASYRGGRLVVSGTVVNYGIVQARSVIVIARYGNYSGSTFIGDMDPASQTAFRIDIECPHYYKEVEIVIVCRDEYNRMQMVNITLPVSYEVLATMSVTSPTAIPWHSYLPVIVAIAVFLTIVGYAILRLLRKYSKKLETTSIEAGSAEGEK